jgi:hypothetical protein
MTSNRPVIIYISAASDLMAEREALARMIAALPVTLAWRVIQTPLGEEKLDLTVLAAVDFHILVMGGDIRAPVGLEVYGMRETGRPSLAFLKRKVVRTSAGDIFVRQTRRDWRPFNDPLDLSRLVQYLLAEHLLQYAERYALTPVEMEQLEALRAATYPAGQNPESRGPEAGHSAVILSRERYLPSEGIIVDNH